MIARVAGDARAGRAAVLWTLIAAKLAGGWGVQWDIRWHLSVGRDSFWIPPHLVTYAAVAIGVGVAWAVLVADTRRARCGRQVPGAVSVGGLWGTPGFHLAAWGLALTVAAAPVDDLWHRLFGPDVSLWSPPHLLGLAGAQVNTVGCLVIARELWPAGGLVGRAALLAGGTLLLGGFWITTDPAILIAFRHGGRWFFLWAVLSALLGSFALVLLAHLSGWRPAPLLAALGVVLVHVVGIHVADAGFALVQPAAALEPAPAAEPDSPIAAAREMARRNGTVPGRGLTLRVLPVIPALLLAAADAHRGWVRASLVFGLALGVISASALGRLPALAHALPSPPDTAAGLTLAALAALAGGGLATALADRARPIPHPAPVNAGIGGDA